MSLWYYEHDGAQEGPVDADTLRRLADEGVVGRNTLVWKDGMADWTPAASVRGLLGGPPPIGGHAVGAMPHGAPVRPVAPGPAAYGHVDNHLAKAILSTLFCCLPLGVVSIVYASQVSGKLQMGYYDDAVATAEKANDWANYSIGVGLGVAVLYLLFIVVVGVAGV